MRSSGEKIEKETDWVQGLKSGVLRDWDKVKFSTKDAKKEWQVRKENNENKYGDSWRQMK